MKYKVTVGFWQLNVCEVEVECDGPLTDEACEEAIDRAGVSGRWKIGVDTKASHIEDATDAKGNPVEVPDGFWSEVVAE